MKLQVVKNYILIAGIATIILYTSCGKEKGELYIPPSCDTSNTKYNDVIKEIFTTTCATTVSCHVNGGSGPGNFALYTEIKTKVDNGTLYDRVYVNTTSPMPPTFAPKQLTDCEKLKLKRWIDKGAQNN